MNWASSACLHRCGSEKRGFTSSHSGTRADAPYHFVEGGERIDAMNLRLFVGPGVIIDVRGKKPKERITVEDLRPHEKPLPPGAIAVVHTVWDEHYGAFRYYDQPFLDRRARRTSRSTASSSAREAGPW